MCGSRRAQNQIWGTKGKMREKKGGFSGRRMKGTEEERKFSTSCWWWNQVLSNLYFYFCVFLFFRWWTLVKEIYFWILFNLSISLFWFSQLRGKQRRRLLSNDICLFLLWGASSTPRFYSLSAGQGACAIHYILFLNLGWQVR